MLSVLWGFLSALISTIIIELAVASFIFKIKNKDDLFVIVLANAITNPLINYVNLCFKLDNASIVFAESIVVLVEAYIYKKYLSNKTNPFVLSLLANISSYLFGVIYFYLKHTSKI